MRSAFDDLHFTIVDTAEQGDRVFVRLRMQGRQTAAFVQFAKGGMAQVVPPTNRAIDFEQIHVLRLDDGRLVSHEAVRDDISMLRQLGIFPPTPGVGLRMVAWRLTGRARRAAAEVSGAAELAADAELSVADSRAGR